MSTATTLAQLAQDFSPRFEAACDDWISLDVSGLDRLLGDPRAIGEELRRSAAARGLRVHIAIAATRTAAMVLAHARPGLTVVDRGREADALSSIRIEVLEKTADIVHALGACGRREARAERVRSGGELPVFRAWGIKTLGELAALPSADLAARLGPQGLTWQTLARGQDVRPLVPTLPDERFEASVELEWPIEGLEPLSFVLTRLLEPLSTRLERRDRGAAALHVTLGLVRCYTESGGPGGSGRAGGPGGSGKSDWSGKEFPDPTDQSYPTYQTHLTDQAHLTDQTDPTDQAHPTHVTSLQLPAPIRDVRALRTLILLDLESHPPPAAVERVAVCIDPTPGRVLQHALFTRARPTPEQLSTLIARLTALMGQDRLGRPALVDSYHPGTFQMMPFAVEHHSFPHVPAALRHSSITTHHPPTINHQVVSALRRCRHPVPARVAVVDSRPIFVTTDRRGFAGGRVLACAGPWRTSGQWWAQGRSGGSGRSGRSGREEPLTHPTDLAHQPHPAHLTHPTFWDRDEWDVSLSDGAVYRVFQDRETARWFIDAIAD